MKVERVSWESYTESSLPYWMLGLNVLGAVSHGVGVILTVAHGLKLADPRQSFIQLCIRQTGDSCL